MQKIQILFPEPQMKQLREAARREDRPISEIVRRAVELWLQRRASDYHTAAGKTVPMFHGGRILAPADQLRDLAYRDRERSV